jgi:ketosteroid isomerase-like protein
MSDDTEQIEDLIRHWATAVHTGDLETVLADHARDIVMYDVPPPYEGVRGLEAYRETWPDFFRWQASGAAFELTELDVTAGTDVAFARALLICGTPDETASGQRLRLTIGLRKEGGRWIVVHEHHSFSDDRTAGAARAEREVRALHERWYAQTAAKDLDGMMEGIDERVVSYEHEAPLQYTGRDQVREACRRGLEAGAGDVTWTMPDLTVVVRDDIAVTYGLNRMTTQDAGGATQESWSRGTRLFARKDGAWSMIHQHVSFPFDPETGAARTDLRP